MQYKRLVSPKIGILTLLLTILLIGQSNTISISASIAVSNDAYADSIINEASDGELEENALGPPDGKFAIVGVVDYEETYITLDMGNDEDIVDGSGMDFTVITQGGRYIIFVGGPNQPLKRLGDGRNNQSFDLASVNLFNAQYVKIQFSSGDDVEIDAIEAINYITGDNETDPPRISGPENTEIFENSSITLNWKTFDASPENYSILFNNDLVDSEPWDGSDITYEFLWMTSGEVQVSLILNDQFGNQAEDTVTIIINPIHTTTSLSITTTTSIPVSTSTTPTTAELSYPFQLIILGAIFALTMNRFNRRKRR